MPAYPQADDRLLDELRPVAFSIAYRMLGSVSEAEDVVQEALLRVHQVRQAGEQITSPRALVATVTTRLAINELQSARARREHYVGEWLPEPIITDARRPGAARRARGLAVAGDAGPAGEPLARAARRAAAARRVRLRLRGDRPIVGKSEDNVRQLASRARRHVEQRRPRFATTREQRDELASRFFSAVQHGDLAGLEALLAADVVLTGDGGGKVPALTEPLRGRARIARLLVDSVVARLPRLRLVEVNSGPGALLFDAQERLIGVMALDIAGDQISSIHSIVNPDKLGHLRAIGDVGSLLQAP